MSQRDPSVPAPEGPASDGPASEASASQAPALEVRGLGLKIGGATILEGVDLAVEPGSFVGVIGPNGAGKTTLFNVVSGLMRPTAGSVHLSGVDVTGHAVHRRARAGLGRTFQTSNLFPALSLLENVRMAAQVALGHNLSVLHFPRSSDPATRTARERLEHVGLGDKVHTRAGDLSHGDKRKLEIAVLLATEPSVVLLDEPMAGVGSGDVPGLTSIIRAMHREQRCTVLMVEHHMEVLMGLVDKVAVMHFGSIIAFDTPQRIMENPLVQSAYLGTSA